MALSSFTIWHLRVIREAIALAAPRVSLSFFWWWKQPGNFYTTFYPTAWLPGPTDKTAYTSAEVGEALFRRIVRPFEAPERVTVGEYGDGALSVPAWNAGDGSDAPACAHDRDPDPAAAARKLMLALDIEWLEREGTVDAGTSELVRQWLDEVLSIAERPGSEAITMQFEQSGLPMALWKLDVYDARTGRSEEVWWPDRNSAREC